eukprot:6324363-Pyramimonas_sp.AAC.1
MCARLDRKPHFENHPRCMRETAANFEDMRRWSDNHILKTARPSSVKLSQTLKTNVCGASAGASFERGPTLYP